MKNNLIVKYYKSLRSGKELEQATVRIIYGVLFLIYVYLYAGPPSLGNFHTIYKLGFTYLAVVIVSLILLLSNKVIIKPITLRYTVLVFEITLFSVGMFTQPEALMPLFFLYIYSIIGSSLRFGINDLMLSSSLSFTLFFLVVQYSKYWQEHELLSYSYLFSLILIPLYMSVFIKRDARIRLYLEHSRNSVQKLSDENRELLREQNNAVEEERRYIARELHDHLNSELLFIKLRLTAMMESCSITHEREYEHNNEKLCSDIESVLKHLNTVYESSRTMIKMLRPEVIDSLGLVGAVEDIIDFIPNKDQCNYIFDHDGDFSDFEYQYQMNIFRIIQVSLANIVEHSQATEVIIRLCRNCEEYPEGVFLYISDNGVGFKMKQQKLFRGNGLPGIRERIVSRGGKFILESDVNEGVTITALIPEP